MRLNKFLSSNTNLSRRKADDAISAGKVKVNDQVASLGQKITNDDKVTLDGELVKPKDKLYLVLNKPTGYVVSRRKQGKVRTVYSLLPEELRKLKPSGRLDKDSRGLMVFSNDGDFIHKITHPKHNKEKLYLVKLDNRITETDIEQIRQGVKLEDGVSSLGITTSNKQNYLSVSMDEGRNKQIRRTFKKLGYEVVDLKRIKIGNINLPEELEEGEYKFIDKPK